jgi:hypothetical protein
VQCSPKKPHNRAKAYRLAYSGVFGARCFVRQNRFACCTASLRGVFYASNRRGARHARLFGLRFEKWLKLHQGLNRMPKNIRTPPTRTPFTTSKYGPTTPDFYAKRFRHFLSVPEVSRQITREKLEAPRQPSTTTGPALFYWVDGEREDTHLFAVEETLDVRIEQVDPMGVGVRHGPFPSESAAMDDAVEFKEKEYAYFAERYMQSMIDEKGIGPSASEDVVQAKKEYESAKRTQRAPEAMSLMEEHVYEVMAEREMAGFVPMEQPVTPEARRASAAVTTSPIPGMTTEQYKTLLAMSIPERDKFLLLLPDRTREHIRMHLDLDLGRRSTVEARLRREGWSSGLKPWRGPHR